MTFGFPQASASALYDVQKTVINTKNQLLRAII